MKLNSSNHNPSVAARALSAVSCQLSANLAPTEQEVALLTTQYRKAVNGLYEAYRFGQMLAQVKARLEQFTGDATCGTARELTQTGANGGTLAAPGWNAGTGLKAWLAEHCPEINYSTARRFLTIAEKTNAALAAAQGELAHGEEEAASRYPLTANSSACEPCEQAVRAYLEGKSQRQVLKAPGKPTPRHAMSEEERAEKLAEVCKGFLESLEGVERTGESDLLRLDDRREIVTRLKALANANLTAKLTWGSPTQTNTISASAGSSATLYIPPKNALLVLSCTAINGAEFYTWLKNGSSTAITANNPSTPFSPASGDTYSCTTRTPYTVTIKAPSGISLAYTFGLNGTQQAAGSVSAGSSKAVKLYRESGGNMTLVLTASPFSLSTFGGWTKDGVVIDPYSNPATIIANEAATYSCLIGQTSTPTTSSGKLLYGKYGNLLYADTLKAAASHTIAISADFEVSGHNVTCYIHRADEAQTAASLSDNDPTFSATRTLSFPATGSASGQLLFADQTAPLPSGSLASQKRLVKILFHCDNAVHKYTLTLKVDGSTIYSASDLSGTFSKTIEVS